MRIERAIEIVQGMGRQRSPRMRPFHRTAITAATVKRTDYVPVPKPWAWATGTAKERGNAVRSHYKIRNLSGDDLCSLFDLTTNGLIEIIRGNDWKPEFAREKGIKGA